MTTTTNSPGRGAMTDVEGISKSFGETKALAGVDMSVPAGTVQGLPGPDRAGKTTLVPILATLLAPGTGRARISGVDVQQDPDTVRSLIGLAGQYAAVDETLTGRETWSWPTGSTGSEPSWPRPGPGSPSSVSPSWRQIAVYPLIPATTAAAASASTAITG